MFVERFGPHPGSRPLPWDVRGRNPEQEVLYHLLAIMARSLRLHYPSSGLWLRHTHRWSEVLRDLLPWT